jgi:hypothetical protein
MVVAAVFLHCYFLPNVGVEQPLSREVDANLQSTHVCRLKPTAVQALVERLQGEPSVVGVGPPVSDRSRPELMLSAGVVTRRTWRPQHVHDQRLVEQGADLPPHAVEWLDAAVLRLRVSAIQAIGKMNDDSFLYFEETEYLLKHRLGSSVGGVPAAVTWHETGSRPTHLWLHNRLRFLGGTAPRHVLRETGRLARSVLRNTVAPNRRLTSAEIRDRRRALIHLTRRWGPDRRDAGRDGSEVGLRSPHLLSPLRAGQARMPSSSLGVRNATEFRSDRCPEIRHIKLALISEQSSTDLHVHT